MQLQKVEKNQICFVSVYRVLVCWLKQMPQISVVVIPCFPLPLRRTATGSRRVYQLKDGKLIYDMWLGTGGFVRPPFLRKMVVVFVFSLLFFFIYILRLNKSMFEGFSPGKK